MEVVTGSYTNSARRQACGCNRQEVTGRQDKCGRRRLRSTRRRLRRRCNRHRRACRQLRRTCKRERRSCSRQRRICNRQNFICNRQRRSCIHMKYARIHRECTCKHQRNARIRGVYACSAVDCRRCAFVRRGFPSGFICFPAVFTGSVVVRRGIHMECVRFHMDEVAKDFRNVWSHSVCARFSQKF